MENLFNADNRMAILRRLESLQPTSPRQWGKMNPAQMMAHCSAPFSDACGDQIRRQALVGKIFAPFVLRRVLGDKPMGRNAPTDPTYRRDDDKDFTTERERLGALIKRCTDGGSASANGRVHTVLPFLVTERMEAFSMPIRCVLISAISASDFRGPS